jgi:cardiolipin synthase
MEINLHLKLNREGKMLKYVPNALTVLRFLLIPIIVIACVQGQYILAIAVLSISGLTDILDGTIARKYNYITDFGKLMDPLADKATQISLLTTLFIKGAIPIWILAIVVLKEFCMVSGASFLYGKELVVSSKWYGKLATVLFYVAMVISLFLEQIGNTTNNIIKAIGIADTIIYYLAVITTIASLIMYMKAFYIQGYLKKNNEK